MLPRPLMCDQEAGPLPEASPLLSRRAPWDVSQKAGSPGALGGQASGMWHPTPKWPCTASGGTHGIIAYCWVLDVEYPVPSLMC